jgi:hypothetical protein
MILGDVQTYISRQQVVHMILRPLSFSLLFLLDLFVACVLTHLTEAILSQCLLAGMSSTVSSFLLTQSLQKYFQ